MPGGSMPAAADEPAAAEPRAVTVVVVTWNGASLLPSCLDALLAQDAPGFAIDVIVVDNGSTDGTVALLASYPVDVVALDANTGFAAAANRGISSSSAPFVVLVNNDAVVQPGFLAALLKPFDQPDDEKLAAVTARIVLADRYRKLDGASADAVLVGLDGARWVRAADGVELLNSTGNEMTRSGNGRDRDWLGAVGSAAASVDVFGFCGGAAALRRAALDDAGGFEASLFLYYEDTDLSWRLRRRGWRIEYADDAVVRHRHAASSGTGSDFFARHNERNRLIVAVRNAPADVVLRAFIRTFARAARDVVRGRRVRLHLSVAREVLGGLPAALRARRAIDRGARVSRGAVARYLVPDASMITKT